MERVDDMEQNGSDGGEHDYGWLGGVWTLRGMDRYT